MDYYRENIDKKQFLSINMRIIKWKIWLIQPENKKKINGINTLYHILEENEMKFCP
jgi:hypothetical protein